MKNLTLDIGFEAADLITVTNLKFTLANLVKENKKLQKKIKAGNALDLESADFTYNMRLIGALEIVLKYHGECGYDD